MIDYGDKIYKLRKHNKLSQADFAAKLGSTRSQISQVEINNQKPTLELITKVINTFGISADYFFHKNAPISNNVEINSNEKQGNSVKEPEARYQNNSQNDIILKSLQDQIDTKDKLIDNQSDMIEILKGQLNHYKSK